MACKLTYDKKASQKLIRTLNQAKKNYNLIGRDIVDKNSEIYLKELKSEIENQTPNWTPLNPAYKKRKAILGLDERILIATGEYLANIQVRHIETMNDKLSNHVGVDAKKKHSNSNLTMHELAMIMEFGTSDGRIPARPLYMTAWRKVLPEIRRNTLEQARSIYRLRSN